MRKRIESTGVEKAIENIDGFELVYKTLHQKVILRGQSRSVFLLYFLPQIKNHCKYLTYSG